LLTNPQRLEQEYQRRGQQPTSSLMENQKTLSVQIAKLRRGIARLIDSYAEGLIEKNEFEPRIQKMKQRIGSLEAQVKHLNDEATLQQELRLLIGRLEEFATTVTHNLGQLDWNTQREIIRLLVKRVEIDTELVNVVFRVGEVPEFPKSELGILQDCGRDNMLAINCAKPGSTSVPALSEHWAGRNRLFFSPVHQIRTRTQLLCYSTSILTSSILF